MQVTFGTLFHRLYSGKSGLGETPEFLKAKKGMCIATNIGQFFY